MVSFNQNGNSFELRLGPVQDLYRVCTGAQTCQIDPLFFNPGFFISLAFLVCQSSQKLNTLRITFVHFKEIR